MSNKKMYISISSKKILDSLCDHLECERPYGLKIALAKGIANYEGQQVNLSSISGEKWTIPDNIIKGEDFLLFKQLIINETNTTFEDSGLEKTMAHFIELGLGVIEDEINNLSALEDYKTTLIKE
ncbi:hypothetical protein [Salipaludibacillus daqingensis]|uniref:hypothetical protein n=1 Tax=Salipaludibacillus daqingensis TaxID=3041001 RepID=UPI0024745345|nr:hypothetical protein [Salipaludibacillus daqingensis]